MNKQVRIYRFINIAAFAITALIFIDTYKNFVNIFCGMNSAAFLILAATVCLIHFIKAERMYLALYGSETGHMQYLKIYCKVLPVSMVIPYKLGEFFRMYSYGRQLGNMLKGIIIILLDRFMDTAALMTIILLFGLFNGSYIPFFIYLLLIFLVLVLLVYAVFPGICQFWKKYFLRVRATENKLIILKMLRTLNMIYEETARVVKGRGIILYFMSLAAWGIEMISIGLLNGVVRGDKLNQAIWRYLTAAIGGGRFVQMDRFVFVSIIMLLAMYSAIKMEEVLNRKKEGET